MARILLICSIRDKMGEDYSPLMTFPSRGSAIRFFGDQCQSEKSPLFGHPDHYELHYLGVFDEGDGSIVAEKVAECLARGVDYPSQLRNGGSNVDAPETRQ